MRVSPSDFNELFRNAHYMNVTHMHQVDGADNKNMKKRKEQDGEKLLLTSLCFS